MERLALAAVVIMLMLFIGANIVIWSGTSEENWEKTKASLLKKEAYSWDQLQEELRKPH